MASGFSIKTEEFEGPLDLLLSLIEKRKMHVSDISLATITDDYIRFIEKHPLPAAHLADFILTAATLMLIKSRSLLPGLSLTKEEAASTRELESRLRQYQLTKDRAQEMGTLFARKRETFTRSHMPAKREVRFRPGAAPAGELILLLAAHMQKIVAMVPTAAKIPQATLRKHVSLDEVIVSLRDRLTRSFKMTLTEFSGSKKEELITGFLALLEILKRGEAKASQHGGAGEITIETLTYDVPQYT